MEDRNACAECGFTTANLKEFTEHIEQHEEEQQRSSSGDLSTGQSAGEWNDESEGSPHSSPSMVDSEKSTSPPPEPNAVSVITATPTKPNKAVHTCPHCNFTTYMSQHMKSHLEAHERHQGQMYQCDICQMQFSQKANMHRHRMRHSGVKPYECRYCKKRFFRKDQMQEHSMTHIKTGADFDCPVSGCALQFGQHAALRAHLDEAHSISAALPASCKRCSLLFANARRLLLHYQTKHDEGDVRAKSEGGAGLQTSGIMVAPYSEDGKKESPAKRKRMQNVAPNALSASLVNNNNNAALSNALLQAQIQKMVKKELSPHRDSQASPDYEHSQNYMLTSEDLLMCLSNSASQSLFGTPIQAATEKADAAMRLWTSDLNSYGSATDEQSHSPSVDSGSSQIDVENESKEDLECSHCGIVFFDQTLHLLHKGLHAEADPWKCNLCGLGCGDKYTFTTHMISSDHCA